MGALGKSESVRETLHSDRAEMLKAITAAAPKKH
jgi:hypothetical protein